MLWILQALAASPLQVFPNAFQRGLVGDAGPLGATLVRSAASACWFGALALAPTGPVRAVGLIEAPSRPSWAQAVPRAAESAAVAGRPPCDPRRRLDGFVMIQSNQEQIA